LLFADNLQVAVKIQRITEENWEDLEEEYAVLKNHSTCPYIPDFYGAYCKKCRDGDQLWLAMEVSENYKSSIINLVQTNTIFRFSSKKLKFLIAFCFVI
jgi:hypothetical protein